MKYNLPKTLLASLSLLSLSAVSTQAAVILTLPTATTAGSLVFTNDISFTITTAGPVRAIIFDEWVTSDGIQNTFSFAQFTPSALSYSLNGGPTATVTIESLVDNWSSSAGSVSPNDGVLFFPGSTQPSVAVNDVFTVKAATYVIAANTLPLGFNPQTNQTFTGNAFLVENSAALLSSVNAVPEPSSALLLVGGLGTLFLRRRKA